MFRQATAAKQYPRSGTQAPFAIGDRSFVQHLFEPEDCRFTFLADITLIALQHLKLGPNQHPHHHLYNHQHLQNTVITAPE